MTDVVTERARFNAEVAPTLAAYVSAEAKPAQLSASSRFVYLDTDRALVIVAGVQEERHCDLALAYGLKLRQGRVLVLVLPEEYALATVQRTAFLHASHQPDIWIHRVSWGGAAGTAPVRQSQPTKEQALSRLRDKVGEPEDELAAAATPVHLGERSAGVDSLVEWATADRRLDSGHRRGERAWHCMGQRVLTIRPSSGGRLAIRAGIHFSIGDAQPSPVFVDKAGSISEADIARVKQEVEAGIEARLESAKFHKPDEHWLQAVIRRRPDLVGVEQPALRELPAWRPAGSFAQASIAMNRPWGRGYIDLLGVDGHGDIRVVETKLATNTDDLLMFQGLDYFVWAQVYQDALRSRLGASKHAKFVVHCVLGASPEGDTPHVSTYAKAQAEALDLPWRFQIVRDWFTAFDDPGFSPKSELLPQGVLPGE